MKGLILFSLLTMAYGNVIAQQKDFEGTVVYKVDVKSKTEGIGDKARKNALLVGDQLTVAIKNGNFKRVSSISDEYYIVKDKKAYTKFKGIDTLFYVDYSSDSTTVTGVSKSEEQRMIAGVACKAIIIKKGASATKYFYAPSFYQNPKHNADNRIGRYDVFVKETESIWLAYEQEEETHKLTFNCTSLKNTPVEDDVFKLPELPTAKFSFQSIMKEPQFTRSGGLGKYLSDNLNTQISAKYIKIPKGEKVARQTVLIVFAVNEYGRTVDIKVDNLKEVHPKLAEEALRVIKESPLWKPATVLGEKMAFYYKLPIVFQVEK